MPESATVPLGSDRTSVGGTVRMLHMRVSVPADLVDDVTRVLSDDPAVSSLAVVREASILPPGDLVYADVAREAANDIVDQLRALGVHREGSLHVEGSRPTAGRRGAARTRWCGLRSPSVPTSSRSSTGPM